MTSYQTIIPGVYTADVESAEWTTTRNGAPMLKLQLAIVGGEFNESKIWTNLVNSTKAAKFFEQKLGSLGITMQAFAVMSPDQVVAAVSGLRVEIETVLSEWNGKTYANVEAMHLIATPAPAAPAAPAASSADAWDVEDPF